MSRAFLKNDGETPEEPVKRLPSGRPNYVTPAGLAQLHARAAEVNALRARLAAAKKPGEPSGLPLRQAELDLSYYEGQIKRAILVDNRGLTDGEVRFGAAVRVREAGGAERNYSIVGEDEADPAAGKLNWSAPLAAALIGAKAGAAVSFERKNQLVKLEVLAVTYPK
ncbi:MAG: GreA/GreB family elongation factor [Elusimicrobiales bacterium]|nr:GreA/GreB family elongation factor [Elusimicrobiales bacterium]